MKDNLLSDCAAILRDGGICVHATEGVFGFACNIGFPDAIEKITALKGRDAAASPYLVMAASIEQASQLVSLDVPLWPDIETSWPGPTTWVFPEKSKDYPWLGGADGSLALRVSAHPQARELARLAGPLVSTSANRHGSPAFESVVAAQQEFMDDVDYYLSGELQSPGQPSRIRHAVSGAWLR
ncbi:MAG: L-threonylcarbamoyladenylate synthase [Pseudomonadota bacterium]